MVPRRPSVLAFPVTLAMIWLAGACNTSPMAGAVERHIAVGGVTRKYLVHAGGEAKAGRALVLVLHGGRGVTPRDFDAAVVLWDFFQSHPRR